MLTNPVEGRRIGTGTSTESVGGQSMSDRRVLQRVSALLVLCAVAGNVAVASRTSEARRRGTASARSRLAKGIPAHWQQRAAHDVGATGGGASWAMAEARAGANRCPWRDSAASLQSLLRR